MTQAELYFLTRDKRGGEVEWALNTLHHSSILKRAFESSNTRPEDPAVGYYISEFASEYIDKFAPPSSEVFSGVQDSLKQLRQMSEATALQRTAHKYDIYAAKAETRDQRICATYLGKALSKLRTKDISGARGDIVEAKRLLPTYCENYRISALIESDASELFAASRELEASEQLDPSSPLVKYTYAIFLLKFLHDYENAFQRIDAALRLDPHDFTLEAVRALTLTRLGRFSEAGSSYEELLKRSKDRPLKRRIELADQAAECFRRWAELDVREKDLDACERHVSRALEIVSIAIMNREFDEHLVRRFEKVLDDGLRYAIARSSVGFAENLVNNINNHSEHIQGSSVWALF